MVKYVFVGEVGFFESIWDIVVIILKVFEKVVIEKWIVWYMRILEVFVDIIWNILMYEDVILLKVIFYIIEFYEFLEGNGEVGSICLFKLGYGMNLRLLDVVSL